MNAIKSPPRESNLPKRIADQLRELIGRGTLPPGLQLRQMDLAERFNASRVPIREALKLLHGEGIVEHDPNRGFFVAPLSIEEARQLYRIRHLLEAELLSTVRWPSAAELTALRAQLKQLESSLQDQNAPEWIAHHRAFYRMLFDLSPEKVLIAEVLRVMRLTDRYRALAAHVLPNQRRKPTPERHLVAALAKRDRKRLLTVFDQDRKQVEKGIETVLSARGI
ncbi:MAG TPA: GntR family transcriptional regulator [Gammaproteobacteria bacterium]|nr:GntR family transcriptional regulator [Gammaproteobacteria bacterium]